MAEPCVPTGNEEWTGDWEYVGAIPRRVQGGHGPNPAAPAIAMQVTYVWRRKFKREYSCCEGAQQRAVWVDGNYAIYTADLFDAGFPVFQITAGIPVPGALGTLADVLGANVTIAQWWVDEGQPIGHKPEEPGDDTDGNQAEVLRDPPRADCGQQVLIEGEPPIPWVDLDPPPPTPPPGTAPPPGPNVTLVPDNPCCSRLNFLQLQPDFLVDGPGVYRRVGGEWRVEATFVVVHRCKIKPNPKIEYGFIQINPNGQENFVDLSQMSPPMWQGGPQNDRREYRYRFDEQVPNPNNLSGRFRIRIRATSECGGTLNLWWEF